MVYLKRLELSNFKSFGNTTRIPLRPGFTVVSGPNGSGKSNILDALLFALGLASSRGMRAERLPDLVSHSGNGNGHARRETSVTVTFALDPDTDLDVEGFQDSDRDPQTKDREWSVTRRLRVTKEGNYSSTYYINGQTCTQSELHEQLQRLRIYPEGYNVVLQGDVTRIITMSSRERREIIDELAGVAEFDRKIGRAKETLETVRERQERCQILEQELVNARDRAATERHKAEKYRNLKAQIEQQQGWETVLTWKLLQQQSAHLETQIASKESESRQLSDQLTQLDAQIAATSTSLEQLNGRVKALGEDEQLAVASQLATQQAQRQQLQQRAAELTGNATTTANNLERTRQGQEQYTQILAQVNQEKSKLCEQTIATLEQECQELQNALAHSREQANAIASASEAWVQQQTALNREISALQQALNPQRTEQAQLLERQHQLQTRIAEQTQLLDAIAPELDKKRVQLAEMSAQVAESEQQVQTLARQLTAVEQERQLQQDTQTRLLKEQREKQRQLDKLEATSQAQQEAQGTYATQAILQADIPGVCGLVAQLGHVEPRYQLALETAAGGRLAHIVVEDDAVAAVGIELLKQKRAGRATFLPLNKIQPPRVTSVTALQSASGFINYAVKLVECEPRYQAIFAYVFGNTAVFDTLSNARPHLGKNRIVTLDGELLESSGAMSGGSRNTRSTIHFGRATSNESAEMAALRQRLQEIEEILSVCSDMIAQTSAESQRLTQTLGEARQQHREQQWQQQQLEQEIERLQAQQTQAASQQERDRQELASVTPRLEALAAQIPQQEAELAERSQRLAELEQSQTPSEWQRLQAQIKAQEAQLQERQSALGAAQQQLQGLENQRLRLEEKIATAQQRQEEYRQHQAEIERSLAQLSQEQGEIEAQIAQTQATLNQLAEKLGTVKSERDRTEEHLRSLQHQHQQQTWQQQKLSETLTEHRDALASLREKIQAQQAELPEPLPELPQSVTTAPDGTPSDPEVALERLQQDLRNAQKRLQAMEPVNMLALEEYERLQARLEELTAKLTTLEAERSELLLRIENFTTRRLQAFQEAFAAVDRNFQTIFATLSQGDGYLQLDHRDDPSNSGLTLIAHPKGKPVRRLHSMSGGEKSLTALSFIFALQRYRPSPFYAFDEVDMFLDGANVERLAKMIKQQAEQAQFIVVSLRRPMIESATHTIGVTQARGAYTQVLGIKL